MIAGGTAASATRRISTRIVSSTNAFENPVTTNAYASLHSGVRKSIRNKGHSPSDEAATKLIWLALRHITAKWKNPRIAGAAAREQFAIQFADRFRLDD